MEDPFKEIADRAHFNIYHSDLWYGTARRFAEMIVKECARRSGELGQPEIGQGLMKHFGVKNEQQN